MILQSLSAFMAVIITLQADANENGETTHAGYGEGAGLAGGGEAGPAVPLSAFAFDSIIK